MIFEDQNQAAKFWIIRLPDWTPFSLQEYWQGVADLLGWRYEDVKRGPLLNVLERWGHGDSTGTDKLVMFCILFALTMRGPKGKKEPRWCRLDNWVECGGSPDNRKAANYIKLPEGSRDRVLWWEEQTPEDTLTGRYRTGMSDAAIDARLETIMVDGRVTPSDAANLFGVKGSPKRDRLARARAFCSQSKRFQSFGDGNYYDTNDPLSIPTDVLNELTRQTIARSQDTISGQNARRRQLVTPDAMKIIMVPWGEESGGSDDSDVRL